VNDATAPRRPVAPVEPIFDRAPHPFGDGPVDPWICDASDRALRQRTVNFAAKRHADMLFVSGLDEATARRHHRWRAALPPAGLDSRDPPGDGQVRLLKAVAAGELNVRVDAADRRVTVRWDAPDQAPIIGSALSRDGYGSILLGPEAQPRFQPKPIARDRAAQDKAWPIGGVVGAAAAPSAALNRALEAFFASSTGVYGIVFATPDRVLYERYSAFGRPDRATPSWSMTKAITATVIGRLLHEGWVRSVHDPAPAPLWRDPRAIHRLVTLDHLMRMRAGLGMPVDHGDGRVTIGFENSAVYQDAADAFDVAQRSVIATLPGSVFRYVNSGVNVMGAIIRDQIESRGLPYAETLYGLLADRLGMASYQHTGDIVGNLIASGAGFATLRDYAKLGVLYLNDGVWNGERLLPKGWAEYALTPSHTGSSYAACFRSNSDGLFPDLPRDTAWAAGASDNKIFILRGRRMTVAVANETDHAMDLAGLNRVIATALEDWGA
jgi:CubicO group peptidase (beta-lactamase class C family)